WIRGQWPELGVSDCDVVGEKDLRVAPEDGEASAEQAEVAGRIGRDRRASGGRGGKRVDVGLLGIVVRERVERGLLAPRGRERVEGRAVVAGKGVVGRARSRRRGSRCFRLQ